MAIVKATNHDPVPPKEKHVRTILRFADSACSQDVKYLLDNIIRRTKGLEDWLMVLKAVTVLHRIYREARSAEVKKKVAHWSRYHLASLKSYKDGSTPQALDMSAFVRTYSLYLYEKFESIGSLEFDPALEGSDAPSKMREMSASDLCEKFPQLQTVMYRAIGCKPQGTASQSNVVLFSFLMVVTESMKIYRSTNDGVLNMLDKFFETDIVMAKQLFDMYKLYLQHANELQELYQFSKSLAFGSTIEFPKLEQPPESFLETMSEYIADLRANGTSTKPAQDQTAIDSSVDLLNFSEPAPAPAPAPAATNGFELSGFENNATFGDNADFLTAPAAGETSVEASPEKTQSPASGGINLDALYGLNTNPAPSAAPQNAAFFGGMQQQGQAQAQPQMAGSPFNNGVAAAQGMMQGMMQQVQGMMPPQVMQQQMMMQQQGMMQQPNAFAPNPMGTAAAPMMQPQFTGSPNSAMPQQPAGGANGFAGGNPFATPAATTSPPSQNSQFNILFSPQQQQQKPQQAAQSPSFDFLS